MIAAATPVPRGRLVAATLLLVGAAALGPFASALLAGDVRALAALGAAVGLGAIVLAGVRGLDLLLLAINLAALAFLPAIHHRSALEPDMPRPFYDWTFLRVTAPELLAAGAIAAEWLRRRSLAGSAPPGVGLVPLFAAGFFAIALLIGLVHGNSLEACLRDGRKIAYVAAAHWLVVRVADDERRRHRLACVLVVALAARALTILVSAFLGQGFQYGSFLRASVDVGDFLGCLALIYFPAARLRGRVAGRGERVLLWLLVALGAAATLATFSRAAWFAAPVGLMVLLFHRLRSARPMPRLVVAAALLGAIGTPLVVGGFAEKAVARVAPLVNPFGDTSVSYRLRELRGAATTLADHPFVGIGLGTRFDAGAPLVDRRRGSETLVHNVFLWSAIKAGLFGLAAIVALLAIPAMQLSRVAGSRERAGHSGNAAAALGLLAWFAAFAALGMAGGMLNQARVAFALGIASGFAQALATSTRAAAERRP